MLSLIVNSGINLIPPYLMGILGLLMSWELHALGVRAGRIKSLDLSNPIAVRTWLQNRSGITVYIRSTPNDAHRCEPCRKANGTLLAPALMRRRKKFDASASSCVNPAGCRCVFVGLAGRWPAARKLFSGVRVRADLDNTSQMTEAAMAEVMNTGHASGSMVDRMGIYLLEALRAEGANPQFAISRYRHLIIRAKDSHDHRFAMPAYLRLSDLLERAGRFSEALNVLDDFYETTGSRRGSRAPTSPQAALLSARRIRLVRRLRNRYRRADLPAVS
jgi:hypothetical protein